MEKHIIIDGNTFKHGDFVRFKALPSDDGQPKEVIGRLCFPEEFESEFEYRIHVCQDEYDGCHDVRDKFGYRYSWVVAIDPDGVITSSDSAYIRPAITEKEVCEPCDTSEIFSKNVENISIFDDDKMPDDWDCYLDLLQLKKELNETT